MKNERLSVRLTEEQRARLAEIAEVEGRSLGDVVRRCLAKALS